MRRHKNNYFVRAIIIIIIIITKRAHTIIGRLVVKKVINGGIRLMAISKCTGISKQDFFEIMYAKPHTNQLVYYSQTMTAAITLPTMAFQLIYANNITPRVRIICPPDSV